MSNPSPSADCPPRLALRLFITLTGFLAGHAVLPNKWFHAGWLLIGGLSCLGGLRMPTWRIFMPGWLYLGWMTLRSLLPFSFECAAGLAGVALLILALVLIMNCADIMNRCAQWTGHISAVAAVISLAWHVYQNGVNFTDYRLMNPLVHGGLNSVCTGMIFGFASLWLSTLPLTRWTSFSALLLGTAAFCSGSRGVMLALLAGHTVRHVIQGWQCGWKATVVLLMAFTVYLSTAWLTPARVLVQTGSSSSSVEATSPLHRAITRPNEGRKAIYRAGLSALDTPAKHLFGIGQWGTQSQWRNRLDAGFIELKGHLHSVFLATYVHGGVVGAALLIVLIVHLLHSARVVARIGNASPPSLLAFGIIALLFDGESLAFFLTLPRFETLIFWMPAASLLALASESSQGASCPSPQ